ncbi:MAG TPA: flagellar biosynthesis anti-sigma factor FlgM [Syntrophales bacterium]|nr:flagellar biosynthesis anti-sigma factor FlgM [Syntrophales bacterium]
MSRHTIKSDCQLKILQIVQDTPDVRQDKVAKLRKQIEQGCYKVDADRVAERMLEEGLQDILYRSGKNLH